MWETAGGWGPAVAGEPPQGDSLPEEETPPPNQASVFGANRPVRPRQAERPEQRGAPP